MESTPSSQTKMKIIDFYTVSASVGSQTALFTNSRYDFKNPLLSILENISFQEKDRDGYFVRLNNHDSIFIELYGLSSPNPKNELFGIIGKSDQLTSGVLQRLKENETEINISDLILEKFTYFYLNAHTNSVAVLSNSQAPKFQSHFCTFLKQITPSDLQSIIDISVYPMLDENFLENLNKIKEVLSVDLEFANTSNLGMELLNLRDAFYVSQNKPVKIKLSLQAKSGASIGLNNLFFTKLKESLHSAEMRSNFSKVQVIAENESGEQMIIDGINQILRKKISIHLEDEYLRNQNNLQAIKEALILAMSS